MHARTHALRHDLHYRPLIMHASREPTVILELSCVFPVKPSAPVFVGAHVVS
jgi:hypothetical protein